MSECPKGGEHVWRDQMRLGEFVSQRCEKCGALRSIHKPEEKKR